uniref:Putative methyltransferase n=1 Tax=viral metagenome TaxID=1070528 RepID=A0A6M3KA65_9ZZZZ
MKNIDRFDNNFFDWRNSSTGNPSQFNIHYPETAKVIQRHFHGMSMLEVGCGMGWITGHLQRMGENCEGFDVVSYAIEQGLAKGVAKNIFCMDMMECEKLNKKWDLVFCINSMAYLSRDEVPIALKNLAQIFDKTLFMSIQTWQNMYIREGKMPEKYSFVGTKAIAARKTDETHDWWLERMFEAGMDLDWDLYKKIKFDTVGLPASDFRSGSVGWRGLDSIFVMKHAG